MGCLAMPDDAYLDVSANRKAVKYSRLVLLRRVLWAVAKPLFRFSPRICFGWRRFLLRIFGATVGHNTHIYNSATIYFPWNLVVGAHSAIGENALIYNLGRIFIGDKVTISQRVHLCAGTHDFTDPAMPLINPPIVIKNKVWVCADAFVGPNVTIDEGAIVGARAVVTRDVPSWTIVTGNPAQEIKKRVMKTS